MKRTRKLIALMATMAMVLSLGVTSAFAAGISDTSTGVADLRPGTDTQITVPKGVTFMNADSVTSYGPGITYSYTLAPATVTDGAMTVKDAQGHITTVHSGPAEGLYFVTDTANSNNFTATSKTAATLAFPATETYTTTPAGTQATKHLTMAFDASKFGTTPGVYRYVITDTTATSALYTAGVTRDDDYDTTRFIDVFVKRNAAGNMEVYGYALKTDNSSTDGSATPATAKDPGYVSESPVESGGSNPDTDRYETYNVTLTKQVEGTLGDRNHEFPFAITVANDSKNYNAAKGDVAAAKAATADAQTSKSTTLKHGETYTLAGLSPHATVAYQETNDTTDLYTVTVAGSSSAIAVTENAAAKTYAVAAGAVSSYETDNSTSSVNDLGATTNYSAVTYTNTLDEVSPTGFIQHFGMIFMIFAAAVMMFVVAASRSSEDEEM